MQIDCNTIRNALLEVASKYAGISNLQPVVVLREASKVPGIQGNHELEQAALTVRHDLFRNGQTAWGYNILNAEPLFCHVTRNLMNRSGDRSEDNG